MSTAKPITAQEQPAAAQARPEDASLIRTIRGLIWTYLILLLFEGAFRKWISPGLSAPLLIIRDPVVVLIYILAAAANVFPTGRVLTLFWLVAIGCSAFGLVAEQFGLVVYLFGWRTNFLHMPLIFLLPRVMTYRHVVAMGRWILILALPMTVLIVQQFLASPTDILNTTAGGTGMQLGTSGGKVRASGTFTFVVGVVCFYAVVAAFVINGFMRRGTYPLWLLVSAGVAVMVAIATSGSRSALAGVITVVAGIGFVLIANPRLIGRAVATLVILLLLARLALVLGVVQLGTDVMQKRFVDAGGSAGIWPRVFGGLSVPFKVSQEAPFFGFGLGLGTNAGAALAAGGAIPFLLGENEWQRIIMESGPVMGNLYLLWRFVLVGYLFVVSIRALRRENMLPMMLFGGAAPVIYSGQFGQPTILGFAVLGAGLVLAAAQEDAPAETAPAAPAQLPRVRSRSRYAEILHGRRN